MWKDSSQKHFEVNLCICIINEGREHLRNWALALKKEYYNMTAGLDIKLVNILQDKPLS